jgi:hypothetical protein
MPAPIGNQNAKRHGAYTNQRRRAAAAHSSPVGGGVDTTPPKDITSDPPTDKKLPSLPDLIQDLWKRQQDLTDWMKNNAKCEGAQDGHYLAAMSLYGQNASRLARMVKLTQGLGNDKTQKLADTLNDALLAAMSEMGIEL